MEPEFSGLGEKERVARCLELAQSEDERANSCRDAAARELHLRLAECWRSMAKQFEQLSSLRSELSDKPRDRHEGRSSAVPRRAGIDLLGRPKRFAT